MSVMKLALACTLVAGCMRSDRLAYEWDDRQVLCSDSIDNKRQHAPWGLVHDELGAARDERRVALFHAHAPGLTITEGAIRRILDEADRDHLEYFTYRELVPGPPRPGLALAFDDNNVEAWMWIRPLLAEHHAHVTFFVSRYELLTDDERASIDQLAADGNDIEPHSVNHLHAPAYVQAHGLAAYLDDEALPSLRALEDAGSTPTSYAYPFGQHTDELDAQMLDKVDRVRVSPGDCPW